MAIMRMYTNQCTLNASSRNLGHTDSRSNVPRSVTIIMLCLWSTLILTCLLIRSIIFINGPPQGMTSYAEGQASAASTGGRTRPARVPIDAVMTTTSDLTRRSPDDDRYPTHDNRGGRQGKCIRMSDGTLGYVCGRGPETDGSLLRECDEENLVKSRFDLEELKHLRHCDSGGSIDGKAKGAGTDARKCN